MALDDRLQAEKEIDANYWVGEPVDMSKALSEGECERELQQSFQNVLRQRLEKNQAIIGHVQNQMLELAVKFKVKTNEKSIKAGDSTDLGKTADLDQNLIDQLMPTRALIEVRRKWNPNGV